MKATWRFISWNIIPVKLKGNRIPLFIDDEQTNYDSISKFTEKQAVDFIKHNFHCKQLFSEHLFENRPIGLMTEVTEPFTNSSATKPGDIDFIIYNEHTLSDAVACQVKTVTAESLINESSTTNRANKLKKGVVQANGTIRFGFSRVYLVIIILDDCRLDSEKNKFLKNTKVKAIESFLESRAFSSLNDSVGVILFRISQFANRPISMCGKAQFLIYRVCHQGSQSQTCTEKLLVLHNQTSAGL